MFNCKICGKEIERVNLKYVFQFTLGDIKFGKFIGEETFYCHDNCLNEHTSIKLKLELPIT